MASEQGTALSIGVTFPIYGVRDRGAIRAYVQGVEELGYDHLIAGDHVVGASRARYEREPPYHEQRYTLQSSTIHEIITLFGYIAGCSTLGLMPGVLILPQRQTVLVAKQAAELDLLTGGNFRLGIGIGWNPYEYEALGQDFSTRGKRSEEQIQLLRRLFTEESPTFEGTYESIDEIGLRPLPLQRPIPIWIGSHTAVGWRRAGRIGDGWIPSAQPGRGLEEAKLIVDRAAEEAGRDPNSIGLQGILPYDADDLEGEVAAWRAAGATHLAVSVRNPPGTDPSDEVDAYLEALGLVATALVRR